MLNRITYITVIAILCLGCASTKNQALPRQLGADLVKIRTDASEASLPTLEIVDPDKIERVIGFINGLPGDWSVPRYGEPEGNYYFQFYHEGKFAGNFYVGANFFGRDRGKNWLQDATPAQIEALGAIVGMDLSSRRSTDEQERPLRLPGVR